MRRRHATGVKLVRVVFVTHPRVGPAAIYLTDESSEVADDDLPLWQRQAIPTQGREEKRLHLAVGGPYVPRPRRDQTPQSRTAPPSSAAQALEQLVDFPKGRELPSQGVL